MDHVAQPILPDLLRLSDQRERVFVGRLFDQRAVEADGQRAPGGGRRRPPPGAR